MIGQHESRESAELQMLKILAKSWAPVKIEFLEDFPKGVIAKITVGNHEETDFVEDYKKLLDFLGRVISRVTA